AARMRGSLSNWSVRGIRRSDARSATVPASAAPRGALRGRSSTVVTLLRRAPVAHRRPGQPAPGGHPATVAGKCLLCPFAAFHRPNAAPGNYFLVNLLTYDISD